WSINDKKYSEAEPIRLRYNERVRIKFINQTMMTHPMHLHGHWMELDNGAGSFKPRKHVISIAPGETVYFDLTADAVGEWAFHCHLLYHMATGMFRKLIVEPAPEATLAPQTGGGDA
ncbi:MAG TPA: copper oxidase, partial [Alphaproteobacteria bacterium]|nr:copper oxidase [Alphaproteobacteria bacterium]